MGLPFAFWKSAATAIAYLLDTYGGSSAAYSLRKLSASTSNVVRVRRSSDNAEQDFTDTEITDGTLTTFTGAGNGFVAIWYDQSGNSNNANQSTASSQPQLVLNGSVILENGKPAVDFNNDELRTATFTASSQPITKIIVVTPTITTNESYIDGSSSSRGRVGSHLGNNLLYAGSILTKNTKVLSQQIFYALFKSTTSEIAINGTSLGTGNAGSQGLDLVILGNHPTNAVNFKGTMQEVLIYASDQSTNRAGIETNINAEYTIY